MLENINKISIIGGPGTGKSTLARNIKKELDLPIYHIDGFHHTENWGIRNKKERDKIILEKIEEEKWVIDGTYRDTLKMRVEKSDMVIFLDYSSIAKLRGILSRYLKNRGKEKAEIPGCRERMNWTFMKQTLNWNKDKRNTVYKILGDNKDKQIMIFKNRKRLNKWYEKEFCRKIEV